MLQRLPKNILYTSFLTILGAMIGFTTTAWAQGTNNQTFVDIVVEPQTYVPPHYTGRPLPSSGSRVRLVALVEEPGVIDPSEYRYVWRMGGRVIGGGAIEGRNTLTIEMPSTRPGQVSVEVARLGAGIIGRASTALPTVEPQMVFYPVHPLYGVQNQAITETTTLTSGSNELRAAPYYLPLQAFGHTAQTVYNWRINGRAAPSTNTNQLNITLQRGQLSSGAAVELEIFNRANWQQSAQGRIQIEP